MRVCLCFRFKTEICSRGSRCNRPFCFFAHKQSEIRKPNFRVQMQGMTCDPVTHQPSSLNTIDSGTQLMSSGMHKTAPSTAFGKRASYLDSTTTPTQLFPSAALSSLSLEGSSISLPDSGSSCDVELSAATWNSWMGNDSPRLETTRQQQQSVVHQGPISQNVLVPPPVSSISPMFPHIPTSEQNAVDWSIWRLPSAERQGSSSLTTPMGYESIWNTPSHPRRQQQQQPRPLPFTGKLGTFPTQTSFGLSPRFMETTHNNVARTLKEPGSVQSQHYNNGNSRSSMDNGYDRNYLLATIRDVYQSMLPGCSPDQQSVMAMSTSELSDGHLPCLAAGLGTTGRVSSGGNSGYHGVGPNGTCGLEGLQQQQNGSLSSNGISWNATNANNDPNGLERIMYALLKTDSNSATCYFK